MKSNPPNERVVMLLKKEEDLDEKELITQKRL